MKKALLLVTACALAGTVALAQPKAKPAPSPAATPAGWVEGAGDGFKAEYYNGANFERKVLTRVDKQINFFLDSRSPAPGIDAGYFSVRWTGQFYAPKTGTYRFVFVADDGVRLWVNDQLLINQWRLNPPTPFSGQITLEGKKLYRFKVEYSQMMPRYAAAQASWSFAGGPEQLLTAKNMFSTPPKPPVAAVKKPAPKPVRKTPPKAAGEKALAKTEQTARKAVSPAVAKTVTVKDTLGRSGAPPVAPEIAASGNKREPEAEPEPIPAVPGPIYFDQSRPELRPECCAVLDELASTLRKYPRLRLAVTGHTDNAGDFFLNVQLSRDRAKAVADYLLGKGVTLDRIAWRGLGGVYPVAPNTSEDNKRKNRRVEFALE
ncbi:MAG: OmpA family protein [Cytophagales bacterium]|nr:OmpA family protein [Cytophagales bacterium]